MWLRIPIVTATPCHMATALASATLASQHAVGAIGVGATARAGAGGQDRARCDLLGPLVVQVRHARAEID
jgi:hypothetical protein